MKRFKLHLEINPWDMRRRRDNERRWEEFQKEYEES